MSFKPADHPFVFFGTPEFANIVLDELEAAGLLPTLIVTQPDRPRGRGRELSPPPAKVWGEERGIDVLQPENLRDDPALDILLNSEWSYFVVAAFGMLIPKTILDLPQQGTLNVHPSLLPKYRGATPVQSQILADDPDCGVSIILLDEEMDHGPVIAAASITPEEWPLLASTLNDILWHAGGELLAETIPAWLEGAITPEEQAHERATFTKKLKKEDGELSLMPSSDPAEERMKFLKFCAFDPWPGTHFIDTKAGRVKITEAHLQDGIFVPDTVIPEGRERMPYYILRSL